MHPSTNQKRRTGFKRLCFFTELGSVGFQQTSSIRIRRRLKADSGSVTSDVRMYVNLDDAHSVRQVEWARGKGVFRCFQGLSVLNDTLYRVNTASVQNVFSPRHTGFRPQTDAPDRRAEESERGSTRTPVLTTPLRCQVKPEWNQSKPDVQHVSFYCEITYIYYSCGNYGLFVYHMYHGKLCVK